jgi:hypothetical protein
MRKKYLNFHVSQSRLMRKNSGTKIIQTPYHKSPPVDIIFSYAKFDVPGTVVMVITILLEVTPCILVEIYLLFRRKFLLMYLTMKLGGLAGCSEK